MLQILLFLIVSEHYDWDWLAVHIEPDIEPDIEIQLELELELEPERNTEVDIGLQIVDGEEAKIALIGHEISA